MQIISFYTYNIAWPSQDTYVRHAINLSLGNAETYAVGLSSSKQPLLLKRLSRASSITEYKKFKLQANQAKFWNFTFDGLTTHPGEGRERI